MLQAQQVKGPEKGVWMHRHKSLGLLAGILVAPRFLFRLGSKIPAPMKEWSSLEQVVRLLLTHPAPPPTHSELPTHSSTYPQAGKLSHLGLYGFMLGMPATGIAMGYYGGKGLPFFWTTIDGAPKADGAIAKQAFSIHKTMGVYGTPHPPTYVLNQLCIHPPTYLPTYLPLQAST